jgi:hypothetical protein
MIIQVLIHPANNSGCKSYAVCHIAGTLRFGVQIPLGAKM